MTVEMLWAVEAVTSAPCMINESGSSVIWLRGCRGLSTLQSHMCSLPQIEDAVGCRGCKFHRHQPHAMQLIQTTAPVSPHSCM